MALEQPKRLIARLAVFKAVINDSDGINLEYCRDISKVNTMFANVDQPFLFVPFESRKIIVVSNCNYVNLGFLELKTTHPEWTIPIAITRSALFPHRPRSGIWEGRGDRSHAHLLPFLFPDPISPQILLGF